MSKKLLFLISFVLVVTLASSSYGDAPVVIGNWENIMDGWDVNDVNVTTTFSTTTGVTLGSYSLRINDNSAGAPTGGNDRAIWYTMVANGTPYPGDANHFDAFKSNLKIMADVTRQTSDWTPIYASSSNIGMSVNAGSSVDPAWSLWFSTTEGGGWQPQAYDGVPMTFTYDYSLALDKINNLSDNFSNIQYLQLFLNTWWVDYQPGGIYYVDNVRILGGGPAYAPHPENGKIGVPVDATFSWTPGAYAATTLGHDVYFGTTYTDVNNADINDLTGIYRGRQDANTYDPGI
ncbi:MAG: hypothetical protein ABSG99_05370, partial [Sedimentisphaerales bacterium]